MSEIKPLGRESGQARLSTATGLGQVQARFRLDSAPIKNLTRGEVNQSSPAPDFDDPKRTSAGRRQRLASSHIDA
jgi:hypothetical protein